MSVIVSKTQLKQVLAKLDSVKLELLRLRAALLPHEELSREDAKKLEEARKEIAKGLSTNLEDLIREPENQSKNSRNTTKFSPTS